jgi:hypothetical protein
MVIGIQLIRQYMIAELLVYHISCSQQVTKAHKPLVPAVLLIVADAPPRLS